MQSNDKSKIVALPSLSCQLSSLPHAKSIDHVSLHPSMYAQRAAESEAKLQKALSKNASQNPPPMPVYSMPPPPESPSPNGSSPLMMRKPQRPKFST